MSEWPRLTKPPIVEGLIDFRVERDPALTVDMLKAAGDELAADFPLRQERHSWTGEIRLQPATAPSLSPTSGGPDGVVMRSSDDRWVAQFRLDGFTVSRLEPYTTWDDLYAKASALWMAYAKVAKPTRVVRIATRFINRILYIEGESFDLTFSTVFSISPSLPQSVAGYLLRVVIPFEREQALAIVTQSLEGGTMDCIFDLDVFCEPFGGMTLDYAWEILPVLRSVKNRLFFESLTAAALEKFK